MNKRHIYIIWFSKFYSFFHELMGVDRDRSSEMACSMEHYMDTVTDERLYAMLEFFRRARADKAPWVDELFSAMETQVSLPNPLSVLEQGQKGTVLRLSADDKLRKTLQNRGFITGAALTCLDASAAGTLRVLLENTEIMLPRNEAAAVWVHIL